MEQRSERTADPHQVILQNREVLELTGVTDVDGFDDTVVTAVTGCGTLTVRGQNLQVNRLDVEAGMLSVSGQIESLQYSRPVSGKKLGRLFR